jgi:hypothetical protein
MTKNIAEHIARVATSDKLLETLLIARYSIEDWKIRSRGNENLSRGMVFNIFMASITNISSTGNPGLKDNLPKVNIIWEFGEFYPGYLNIIKEIKKEIVIGHQEPIEPEWYKLFNNIKFERSR